MATDNEAETPPTNQEGSTTKKASGFLIKAFLWLGALQVYNIITRQQDLISLSQSIHLIVDWWRWAISQPFILIGLHIPLLQREIIAVFLFFGAAANLAWFRATGSHFIVGYLTAMNPRSSIDQKIKYMTALTKVIESRKSYGAYIFILILFFSLAAIPQNNNGSYYLIFGIFLLISSIAGFLMINRKNKLLSYLCFLLSAPLYVMVILCASIIYYWKEIVRTLKYLLIVLAADIIAKFAIDPLLARWPELPQPPSLPF